MKFLSSLRFMVVSSFSLVLWLVIGAVLGKTEVYKMAIVREMNDVLIRDWIFQEGAKNPVLCLWLIIVILIAGLLLVNIFLCTWNKLLDFAKIRMSLSRVLLLAMHVLFFVLVIMHGISFIWGYKAKAGLSANGTLDLPGGTVLRVDEICFVDDPGLLRMDRHSRTNEAFHWKENYARVSLMEGEQVLLTRELRHMTPLFYDGTQVSLFRFSDLSPGAKADEKKRGCNVCGGSKGQGPKKLTLEDVRPGVLLIISRNPIGPAFFWFYALFILSIGGYLAVVWSGKGDK